MNTKEKLERIKRGMTVALSTNFRVVPKAAPRPIARAPKPILEPIAIVGIAGRFPQCRSVAEFWEALDRDANLVEEVPRNRFDWREVKSKWGGFIPGHNEFDPSFFQITHAEAELMDPRQRLLLMTVYHGLEDAGYTPDAMRGSQTGVFVAAEEDQYAQCLAERGLHKQRGMEQSASMLANRISYFFDFHGPSEYINTMCSGAAVALHRATQALRSGEIQTAVVAAANLLLRPEPSAVLARADQLSPERVIKSYGKNAKGHLRSEGVASVVLKPLAQAEADGDLIYALINNTAVNHNGRGGMSIAAPNPASHAALVESCYTKADIDPRRLTYIEAQGMGNPLADHAEWTAFNVAIQRLAAKRGVRLDQGQCRLSTLKPMLGHMESTSALGALFKIIRSLQTDTIHKIQGFEEINPELDTEGSPCRLATQNEAWQSHEPRLAGIHSFGSGGNNAHILIEEYKSQPPQPKATSRDLIVLSALTEDRLQQSAQSLLKHLERHPDIHLNDLAHTLRVGRAVMPERLAVIVDSTDQLRNQLDAYLNGNQKSNWRRGSADQSLTAFSGDEDLQLTFQSWLQKGKFDKLLDFWLKGFAIQWHQLESKIQPPPCKLHLPGYPFSRKHYWFEAQRDSEPFAAETSPVPNQEPMQPTYLDNLETYLQQLIGEAIKAPEPLALDQPLTSFGLNSISLLEIRGEIEARFGQRLPLSFLMDPDRNLRDLAQHLGEGDEAVLDTKPAAFSEQEHHFPLAQNQRALWLLHQFSPESTAYNIAYSLQLAPEPDVPALRKALQAVVQGHPILRTTYATRNDEPVQIVHDTHEARLQDLDASDWSEESYTAWLAAEADQPFDLEQGPVFRAHLLSDLEGKEPILVWTVHHIAWDFVSFEILVADLEQAYHQALTGKAVALPASEWQYKDFVNWERDMLTGEEGERLWSYWQERLAGELPSLDLPTDHLRPPVKSYAGAIVNFSPNPTVLSQLQAFTQQTGSTPFMVFLSVFYTLLYRYTGQDDILIGSPMIGRDRREFARILGYFISPVVLRTTLNGNLRFADLLARVRGELLAALDHKDFPFGLLVEKLAPERDPDKSPIFQVSMNLEKISATSATDGLVKGVVEGGQRGAAFDLTLNLIESDDDLSCQWVYSTDLFEQETIERMSQHFQTLLDQVLKHPQQTVSSLDLLTAEEQQRMLLDWNDTQTTYNRKARIEDQFEDWAKRTPNTIAVSFEDQTLTYANLNARANQVAHQLIESGIRPDDVVAVFMERSLDLMVGLMGILKSGAAYLPLDPDVPMARLQMILEDAEVPLILSQKHLASQLENKHPARVIRIDDDSALNKQASHNPRVEADALGLAYVMFTSGSSGRPKGVMVSHRNLVNLFVGMAPHFQFTSSDVFTLFHSYGFDLSVGEYCGALLHGARLVVVPYLTGRSPSLFRQLLLNEGVTVITQTPTAFYEFMGHDLEQEPASYALRRVIFCGEALQPENLQPWIDRYGDAQPQLINMYGITETSVYHTYYPVESGAVKSIIGKPILNQGKHILDRHLRALPVGIPGEIMVKGDGLSRGYLDRPALTAERFVPDPYATEPGGRLYRTGDLGRYLATGDIEFLGRIDRQIKIRGFRIELGEIEATLDQHPQIKASTVLPCETANGDKRLIAFYIPSGEQALESRGLRAHLLTRLPAYMVPWDFLAVDNFPRNASGKTDGAALLNLFRQQDQEQTAAMVLPSHPDEEMLAEIWCDVLERERVGTTDNFFELGGHSLLAMKVVSRIRDLFAVEFPAMLLFRYPTIQALVKQVRGTDHPTLPAITPLEAQELVPLSFGQSRLWFLSQLEGLKTSYNISFAFRLEGELDREALDHSHELLVRRHEILRRCYPDVKGAPVAAFSDEHLGVHFEDLSIHKADDREHMMQAYVDRETQKPFDLARGPLFRAVVLRLGDTDHVLILTMHHIIADGWSLNLIARELSELYNAHQEGQPARLPDLPIRYEDFAAWQRKYLGEKQLNPQMEYWRNQLEGMPPSLELPSDMPRPNVRGHKGSALWFDLDPTLQSDLKELVKSQDVTLFMVLLATYGVLLCRYTGKQDIPIGSPIAGRGYSQVESLVGLFINTLVMRIDLSDNPDFVTLLQRVKQTSLEAYANQDVPFEQLVEELQPDRNLSHSPLFQVMLSLNNTPMNNLQLKGLNSSQIPPKHPPAKVDLSLSLAQDGDQLSGFLEYSSDLFLEASMSRLVNHFQTLLTGFIENPQQPIALAQILEPSERERILVTWNTLPADQAPFPNQCIHQIFEAQAQRLPQKQAIILGWDGPTPGSITYAELDQRANQLAHHLIAKGVGPDALIGLAVERSLEMFIGLLGILKAGAGYIPLDPTYPPERLATMIDDARPAAVLTVGKWAEKLPESVKDLILFETLPQLSTEKPQVAVTPNNRCYVIYTSGSTGKPKGVMIPHHGVVRLVVNTNYIHLDERDCGLQSGSLAFDNSSFEVWGQLLNGGTIVCLAPEVSVLRGDIMADLIKQHKITTISWVCSIFNHHVDQYLDLFDGLCTIIIGGEKASTPHINKLFKTYPDVRIILTYGPMCF